MIRSFDRLFVAGFALSASTLVMNANVLVVDYNQSYLYSSPQLQSYQVGSSRTVSYLHLGASFMNVRENILSRGSFMTTLSFSNTSVMRENYDFVIPSGDVVYSSHNSGDVAVPFYMPGTYPGNSSNAVVNMRYGLFNWLEIFGNFGTRYYVPSAASRVMGGRSESIAFGSADAGLLLALYRGSKSSLFLGDRIDVINSAYIGSRHAGSARARAHTAFANLVSYGSNHVDALQISYRFYLRHTYNIFGTLLRNGDVFSLKYLRYMSGGPRHSTSVGMRFSSKLPDVLGDVPFDRHSYSLSFLLGYHRNISRHFGFNLDTEILGYNSSYPVNAISATFGFYFKI